MRISFLKIWRKTLAFVLLGFVLLLTANQTFYTHSHILDNGTVITHAHPYDKGADNAPLKSHHHSQAELLVFNIFSFLWATGFSFAFTVFIEKVLSFHFFNEKAFHSTCWRFILGRAPPKTSVC